MRAALLASTALFRPFSPAALATPEMINAAQGIVGAAGAPPVTTSGVPGQTVFGDDLVKLDTRDPDNLFMNEYWKLVHDLISGAKAMRDGHLTYLPQFPHENAADYEFRWKNAKFTNVYRDVLENLASKPFEQEVTLVENDKTNPPEQIVEFIEDVDGAGSHITQFASDDFFSAINNAINWILVDMPPVDPGVRTVADERASGRRPFWSHVLASNVLGVRSKVINGKERLVYVRILEHEPDGRYIRIFRADANLAAWELYREVDGPKKFEFVGSGPITINVIPMTPTITGRRIGRSFRFYPPMKDAAELSLELFQQESALKNLETLSGFPMLVGAGVSPPKKAETLASGPQTVLYAPMDGQGTFGDWKFISPDASILKYHLDHTKETIDQIRELGRNPLTAQSGNLTVITAGVAAKKGNSAVQQWAYAEKNALENALVFTCMWLNINPESYSPEVNVFTDFQVEGQSEDVTNLIAMRKNGDISQLTFWHEMVRRGVFSGEFNPEKEREYLLQDVISPEGVEDDLPNPDDPGNGGA
jgi:hypothetical protein